MKEIGDIVRAFEQWPREPLALATLVRARGSSYRRCGARMLIAPDGRTVGSLSGGCLEEEVVEQAREVLCTGQPKLLTFDTRRRFGCNGALEIFVESADRNFLSRLSAHHQARQACTIATDPGANGGSRLVQSDEEIGPADFVQNVVPALQLLSLGSGPDHTALVGLATALGWAVRVLESAGELENSYDEWTAAVVKTHNYGRDFAALRALMPLGLFYIGLLGPRARREQLLADLLDTGVEAGPNLFAPAGLDLGGDSPETVALSIVAEIQAVSAGGSRVSLRDRKAPIHAFRPELAAAVS